MKLSQEESEHTRAMLGHLRGQISAAGGWISFERFMELALYAPGLGYYSAGSVKLGPDGDFVTAPELSDLFSRCVARQCAQVLARIAGGSILELGAGTGRMASAILRELGALAALPERYLILEVSADLAARQRERIARLPGGLRERVVWLESLPVRPLRGVILANEVLDALPCRRFRMTAGAPRELGVGLEGDALVEREAEADATLSGEVARIVGELPAPLEEGYVSEICLRAGPWVATLGEHLESGAMLLFDYGLPRAHYYHPQRSHGTLRCHHRHRVHDDALANPGLQDITAWVDFTRVAEAGLDAGLELMGFTTQAGFLLGNGIEALACASDTVQRVRLASEARQLLLPGEMGEAVKVMALGRACEPALAGFALQDLRRTL